MICIKTKDKRQKTKVRFNMELIKGWFPYDRRRSIADRILAEDTRFESERSFGQKSS